MQEITERYENSEVRMMANEQYSKLTLQEKQLHHILTNSIPIQNRLIEWYDNYKSIINFKTKVENERTYFSFDIVNPLSSKVSPEKLNIVNGSIISNDKGKNIVYTIYHGNGTLDSIYVDNYTNVTPSIVLNEVTYINTRVNTSRVGHVELTIFNTVKQDEKFIIDPNSDIYKLYSSKQIDMVTLCNLALLQANNKETKIVEEKTSRFTKQLSKKFI